MLQGIHAKSLDAEPTAFHRLMAHIAGENRLLRHYTQNIDGVERFSSPLVDRTVRLHGEVSRARCPVCKWRCTAAPLDLQDPELALCQACSEFSENRVLAGKRPSSRVILRPDVVLYGEPHPEEEEIGRLVSKDLNQSPDAVVVVGTRLQVPGARNIVKGFCEQVKQRGGPCIWINKKQPPARMRAAFTKVLQGDCDKFAMDLD